MWGCPCQWQAKQQHRAKKLCVMRELGYALLELACVSAGCGESFEELLDPMALKPGGSSGSTLDMGRARQYAEMLGEGAGASIWLWAVLCGLAPYLSCLGLRKHFA